MRVFLVFSIAILLAIAPSAEAARRGDAPGGSSSGRSAVTRPAAAAANRPAAIRPGTRRPATRAPRPAASQPGRTVRGHAHAAASRGVASADSRYASAHRLCARGGKPVRGGRCRSAGAAEYGGASRGLRWQAGLPPAGYTQRECPDGTLATLARGHDDVVRCVPL